MPRSVRPLRWLALLAASPLVAPLWWSRPAQAAPPPASFRASAAADGIRQQTIRPEAPLSDEVADAATPSAQAAIDSLGDSNAYSSFLYPGANALSVPGLLSGAAGRSLPSYPIIATSDYPSQPRQVTSAGPAEMSAGSTADASTATSSFVSPGSGVERLDAAATASIDRRASIVTATASSDMSALSVAGVLRISSVRASATATSRSGHITSSSSLEIGSTSIAGVAVVLTPAGFALPGQRVALPDLSPVLTPLREAGVTVELLGSDTLRGGVESGGLRISLNQHTPDGGSATVSFLLGQARAVVAALDGVGAPSATQAPAVLGAPGGGGAEHVAADPGAANSTQPVSPNGVAALNSAATPLVPASSPPLGPVSPVASATGRAAQSVISIYLILVFGGATVLVAQALLRKLGVQP